MARATKSQGNLGGISVEWFLGGAAIVGVLFFYLRGKSASNSSTATSVVDATNTPTYPVTSMGHPVDQGLPPGQVTPNEPGTAPIFDVNGVYQYGGS